MQMTHGVESYQQGIQPTPHGSVIPLRSKHNNRMVWGFDIRKDVKDKPVEPGDEVEILNLDGERHPELEGKIGRIHARSASHIATIEVDGILYKSNELWWRRRTLLCETTLTS